MKPLHVRVAISIGWTDLRPARQFSDEEYVPHPSGKAPEAWYGHYDGDRGDEVLVPRFDTDWSATGPLIEEYKINLAPPVPDSIALIPEHQQWVARSVQQEDETFIFGATGNTPLMAVCNLLLLVPSYR